LVPSAGEHSEIQSDDLVGALRDAHLYRREHAMKLPHRRQFLHLAAGAAALPAISRSARAQAYPTRPVRLVVTAPPGGGTDITARLIGEWLSERLGQQFIIENRAGAGGNIGTEAVVRAAPDGYTPLLVFINNAINATSFDKLNFNFIRDIAPVATISGVPAIMAVHPSVPAKTIPEFIAYAKANPGRANMASEGIGGFGQLSGEMFKMMTGVNMLHVPYRGGAPALADLLGGQVQVTFASMPSSIAYVRAGQLRALAVTTAKRSEALPEVPTVGEFLPGYDASIWYGVGAPKKTPTEIVEKLNKEINAALADPKLKARFAELGAEPMMMTPAEFESFVIDETEKWAKVIRAANIKVQ
jgi:tripartite-type tricarboxylate transporter receptor subunit TctC